MITSILLRLQAEQPAGFDHLQRLVHQRGGIDRDLRAHPPGRVPQRIVGRDVVELRPRDVRETGRRWRSSTTGATSLGRLPARAWKIAPCSLSTGDQRRAASSGQLRHQRAGNDQSLLVGQGDGLARFERGPRAGQASRADHRRDDNVDFGIGRDFLHALVADQQLGAGRQVGWVGGASDRGVGDRDEAWLECACLLDERGQLR